jgi:hypothetical protein
VSPHSGALEAVDRILNRGGETGDVLRQVVAVLHERVFTWVGIVFDDEGVQRLGPEAGERPEEPALRARVVWQADAVGEVQAEPREPAAGDRALLERVALLISPQVRAGRDARRMSADDVA